METRAADFVFNVSRKEAEKSRYHVLSLSDWSRINTDCGNGCGRASVGRARHAIDIQTMRPSRPNGNVPRLPAPRTDAESQIRRHKWTPGDRSMLPRSKSGRA